MSHPASEEASSTMYIDHCPFGFAPLNTDKALVCTHATFRFAVEELGIEAFDNRLIAIDEFHHVSSNPDNKLGSQLGAFIVRDKVHLVPMTGSYFRGDSGAGLVPADEAGCETIT